MESSQPSGLEGWIVMTILIAVFIPYWNSDVHPLPVENYWSFSLVFPRYHYLSLTGDIPSKSVSEPQCCSLVLAREKN